MFWKKIEVIPAVNVSNPLEAKALIEAANQFSSLVGMDISDGKFAKSQTLSMSEARQIKIKALLSIHYMGANNPRAIMMMPPTTARFIFHYETCADLEEVWRCIDLCYAKGVRPVVGIAPDTKISSMKDLVEGHDYFHLLSVYPGKSGQKLIPKVLNKSDRIKKLNHRAFVGVDGGVNVETAHKISNHPINYVSATSAIFGYEDYKHAHWLLKKALR